MTPARWLGHFSPSAAAELSSRGGHRRSPVPPGTGVAADPRDLPNVTNWAGEAFSRDSFDAGDPRAGNRAERPSGEAPEFVREGWFGARPRAGDRGGAGGEAQYPPPGVLGQSGQFGVATRRVRCCGTDGCSGAGIAPRMPPRQETRTGRDRGPRCDGEPCRRRTLTAYPAASASASRGSSTSTPCHPPVASRLYSSEHGSVSGGRPRPRTPPRRSIGFSPRPSTRTGPPAVSAPSRCCPVWPASASSTPHRSPRRWTAPSWPWPGSSRPRRCRRARTRMPRRAPPLGGAGRGLRAVATCADRGVDAAGCPGRRPAAAAHVPGKPGRADEFSVRARSHH
ncbi:hypothetical protein GA0115247_103213 [Streptomyces sp. PalvLS-984]|nr:hypothetical protein GA0115247_103213 [Streptomyces sp. PalvLS-984]